VINAVNAGDIQVLGPPVADETIGRSSWGFVPAAQTAGSLAGGLLAARRQPRRPLLTGVAVTFVDVVPLTLLGTRPC